MTNPYVPDPAQMQGYAQPQQQFAPPAPQPPQQFAPPTPVPPGYAQPQQFAPPQQFAQPYAPQFAPPAPPVQQHAAPTLDSFFSQPSVGWGPSWQFNQQTPVGTTCVGVVARPITKADVENQTGPSHIPGQPGPVLTYADGRPKQVMKVPMLVQQDARFTEGRAVFYVQGSTRDELARAMAAAGAPEGPPEVGATIQVTKASEYRNNFGTMSSRLAIVYQRPAGAAPAPQQAPVPAPQQAPAPAPQQAAAPVQPPAPGPAPTGLDPTQQQVLAGLLGQQG